MQTTNDGATNKNNAGKVVDVEDPSEISMPMGSPIRNDDNDNPLNSNKILWLWRLISLVAFLVAVAVVATTLVGVIFGGDSAEARKESTTIFGNNAITENKKNYAAGRRYA